MKKKKTATIYAVYKGKEFKAYLNLNDLSVTFKGEKFKTPTGAAVKAKKGKAANGWLFWMAKVADGYEEIGDLYRKNPAAKRSA